MIEVGKNYFVRTVTDYWTGRVVSIDGPNCVTLEDFAWVASTGRLGLFLATGGYVKGKPIDNLEVEAAPDGLTNQVVFVSIIDWPHKLLRETYPA